jgi:hypothetical protein
MKRWLVLALALFLAGCIEGSQSVPDSSEAPCFEVVQVARIQFDLGAHRIATPAGWNSGTVYREFTLEPNVGIENVTIEANWNASFPSQDRLRLEVRPVSSGPVAAEGVSPIVASFTAEQVEGWQSPVAVHVGAASQVAESGAFVGPLEVRLRFVQAIC